LTAASFSGPVLPTVWPPWIVVIAAPSVAYPVMLANSAGRPALAEACAQVTLRHAGKRAAWGITVSED